MQKNTKILLGLGLIGLAYYLWNKSSKKQQDVNSNMPEVLQPKVRGCSGNLMPCPDDSGCFDPSKNPISDWEAGRPHPCNRAQENPLLLKIREKRAKELSNEWCEIMSKAKRTAGGLELNKEEETRANQIGKQVEQLGYTGLGFSILSGGVPNCNQLITIEESNKYPRF